MYYFKIAQGGKLLITSTEPVSEVQTVTKEIAGRKVQVRQQMNSGNIKFAQTVISPEDAQHFSTTLKVGDEIPSLEITEKKVVNQETGKEFDNLYWAH